MKLYLILTAILILSALTVPVVINSANEDVTENIAASQKNYNLSETSYKSAENENHVIRVLDTETQKVSTMDMVEYITGTVAGEMPASFCPEALKAQAVASYTYAKYIMEHNTDKKITYDITDSSDKHQCYIDTEKQKEKWGDSYDEYKEKIKSAVESIYGEYLTYNGETALSVFHAVSIGNTNSAEEIWGKTVPYLVSVTTNTNTVHESNNEFTADKFKNIFAQEGVTITDNNPRFWAQITEKDENGYIKILRVGDNEFTALEIKGILSLPSVSFTAKLENDNFIFTCYGKGHGVGMSQYGAEHMAQTGKTYKEILAHFYPGTKLTCD